MILCLWSPLHPLSKLLEIEDHTQNLKEQLWMGGRREVSIISHSPVTRSDLRHERSFFHGSVSTFLQLVAAINISTYKYVTFWGSIFLSFCIIKLWELIQSRYMTSLSGSCRFPIVIVSYTRSRSGSFSYSCSFSNLRVPDFPDAHLKL